jgi:surface antigen
MKNICAAVFGLMVVALFLPNPASASRYLQCVPYAREVSGIEIHGNAKTWWGQAAGKYERGSTPREGAVLAFPGHGKMWAGHVATVSKIVSDREILLNHANWSRRGGIERGVRAIDVSDNGDWSKVRVWFAPMGDLGLTAYPTQGFIYPGRAPDRVEYAVKSDTKSRQPFELSRDVLELAMLER